MWNFMVRDWSLIALINGRVYTCVLLFFAAHRDDLVECRSICTKWIDDCVMICSIEGGVNSIIHNEMIHRSLSNHLIENFSTFFFTVILKWFHFEFHNLNEWYQVECWNPNYKKLWMCISSVAVAIFSIDSRRTEFCLKFIFNLLSWIKVWFSFEHLIKIASILNELEVL